MKPAPGDTGYSLIELLVVMAILLLIAAIAIPNFFRSRMSANEAAAVENLRNITTALSVYRLTFPDCGFPDTLANLQPGNPPTSTQANLLEATMASDSFTKSGYIYTYQLVGGVGDCTGEPGNDFHLEARPGVFDRTGRNGFFVDATLTIRRDGDGDADANSPPI